MLAIGKRAPIPWTMGHTRVLVAFGGAGQLVLLGFNASGVLEGISAAACGILLLGIPLLFCFLIPPPAWLFAAATTGGIGGLGMLIGSLIDRAQGGSDVPLCHMSHGAFPWVNWMNGLMLLACIPACLWLCPSCARHQALRPWWLHVSGTAGMAFGMLLGGRWIATPTLGAIVGAFPAMHWGMLAGMMLAAGFFNFIACVQRISLDPPHPAAARSPGSRFRARGPVPSDTP